MYLRVSCNFTIKQFSWIQECTEKKNNITALLSISPIQLYFVVILRPLNFSEMETFKVQRSGTK